MRTLHAKAYMKTSMHEDTQAEQKVSIFTLKVVYPDSCTCSLHRTAATESHGIRNAGTYEFGKGYCAPYEKNMKISLQKAVIYFFIIVLVILIIISLTI